MDERDYRAMNRELNPPLKQPFISGSAYLVAIKSGKEIKQRIVVARDVFDVEKKVLQTFKRIEWWEIRCNYGSPVF